MHASTRVVLVSLILFQCTVLRGIQKISPSAQAPSRSSLAIKVVSGAVAKGVLEAGDSHGGSPFFSISDPPAHGTVQITDANRGRFQYSSEPGYFGWDSFSYRVSDGAHDSNPTKVTLQVTDGVRSVVSGSSSSCALTAKGRVKCWGSNSMGQLGFDSPFSYGDEPGELGNNMPFVEFGDEGGVVLKAISLTMGETLFCALLNNHRVKCWGKKHPINQPPRSTRKILDHMGNNLPFVDLGTEDGTSRGIPLAVKSLSSSYLDVCAILQNDRVKCWGANSGGELGIGDTIQRGNNPGDLGNNLPYVDLGTISGRPYRVKAIATSLVSTCALLEDDRIKCWGYNNNGELFLGDTDDRGGARVTMGDALPFADSGFTFKGMRLAAGIQSFFVLTPDGKLRGWGRNRDGILGLGNLESFGLVRAHLGIEPRYAYLGGPGAKLDSSHKFSAGATHACALMDTGNIKCWGSNASGELGLGDTMSRGGAPTHFTPAIYADVLLTTGNKIRAIDVSAGREFTCAVLQDGSVRCWGLNNHGQLGVGDRRNRGTSPSDMGDALLPVPLLD